jgi:hypothetical protein
VEQAYGISAAVEPIRIEVKKAPEIKLFEPSTAPLRPGPEDFSKLPDEPIHLTKPTEGPLSAHEQKLNDNYEHVRAAVNSGDRTIVSKISTMGGSAESIAYKALGVSHWKEFHDIQAAVLDENKELARQKPQEAVRIKITMVEPDKAVETKDKVLKEYQSLAGKFNYEPVVDEASTNFTPKYNTGKGDLTITFTLSPMENPKPKKPKK